MVNKLVNRMAVAIERERLLRMLCRFIYNDPNTSHLLFDSVENSLIEALFESIRKNTVDDNKEMDDYGAWWESSVLDIDEIPEWFKSNHIYNIKNLPFDALLPIEREYLREATLELYERKESSSENARNLACDRLYGRHDGETNDLDVH